MIDNYKLALTTLGSDLMAKNLAGSTIEFTKFVLGSGTYAGTESTAVLAGMTALKTPKSTFGISKVEKQNGATCKITLAATNLNETAGFYISEIGIYAKGSDGKEILYAIIMLSPDQREWFPPYNSQVPASLDLNVFLSVGNSDNVTLSVDAGGLALQKDLEAAEARITALEQGSAGCVGVRKKCAADGTPSSSTPYERFGQTVGMSAVYARGNDAIDDPLMNIWPFNKLRPCDLNLDGTVAAYLGDPGFNWEPETGCVMLEVPNEMYYSRWFEKDATGQNWEYRCFSDTGRYPNAVYIKDLMKRADGSHTDAFYFPIFMGYTNTAGNYVSKANVIPTYNRSCTQFRADAKKNGANWQLLDKWAWDIMTNLALVYSADDNFRTTYGRGHADWFCSYKSLLAESSVNTITVSNSAKSKLFVGNTVCIGTSDAWDGSVAQNRTITAIKDSTKADNAIDVTLDGAAFTTTTTSTLWRSAPRTGETVNMANANGTAGPNDGQHANRMLWIEDFFGTMHTGLDAMNLKFNETDMCLDTYVCNDPSKYSDTYDGYTKVDSMKIAMNGANTNSNYDNSGWIKKLGFDKNYPTLEVPVLANGGAGSESYLAAYRWANRYGARPFTGGAFYHGSQDSARSLVCHNGFGNSYWNYASRPLKR